MTRAAQELYLRQPTVSQAIAELEAEYGVKLFERLNHRLYLTASGERLQEYARHILNLTEQAKKELNSQQGGTLRVGASLTTGTYLLPAAIRAFKKEMPEVEIYTHVDNTNVIEKMILDDDIDLGLVEGPVTSSNIIEKTIREDHLVVICSSENPLARKKALQPTDLEEKGFLIREPGSGTRRIFENALEEAEVNWKVAGVYNNTESIKQAVKADLGLAVVPWISIDQERSSGQLVALEIQGLKLARKFNLIYHRQKFFTPAMKTLMQWLEN
jgi:DNA-binding transcriptional LysR family regulator